MDKHKPETKIYPLDEHDEQGKRRTVNERLVPIYVALAQEPNGWEKISAGKVDFQVEWLPVGHEDCNRFRLDRKKRMVRVPPFPEPMREAPGEGAKYWLAHMNDKHPYGMVWRDTQLQRDWLAQGLCFWAEEDAQDCIDARKNWYYQREGGLRDG